MSDPTNPIAPGAQEPVAAPPAAVTPSAPAPVAAAPQTAPEAPSRPPYVNPWAGRVPAPVAPAASAAQPAAPTAPAADPRVDALMGMMRETVEQDIATLPANVAAMVRAVGKDDVMALRGAINAARANGLAAAPNAPLPAPASTVMPTAPATPTAAPGGDDAVRLAEYEKLRGAAPTIAQAYRMAHADSISRALAARSPAN